MKLFSAVTDNLLQAVRPRVNSIRNQA